MINNIVQGEVLEVFDEYDGERIKVFIRPFDKSKPINKLPYAFPLLPKTLHIKPKVGETVLVLFDSNDIESQRYYIGPIISQPQKMYFDEYGSGSGSLLKGSTFKPLPSQKENEKSKGCYLKEDEIGILGRKNTQIILSDNDLRIRCGVSILNPNLKELSFNKVSPAFIKLKYFENNPLKIGNKTINSTAMVVADSINLISNNGDPYFNTSNNDESITNEEIKRIIENAHELPYGDKLCEFLLDFVKVFENHVHQYGPSIPVQREPNKLIFNEKYGNTLETYKKILLSSNIKIN